MASVTIKPGGEIALSQELCRRYRLTPDMPIRVIETRAGILLIPLTTDPMEEDLAQELAEWQKLGEETWDMFPFQEISP